MNSVLTFLQQNQHCLELARYGVTGPLTSIVLTPRFRASSHVVFLIMNKGSRVPQLVAKIPRLAHATASIEREVASLRAVQALRPKGFDSIPRIVAFEPYCGYPLLVETALIGSPLDPPTVRRNLAQSCATVIDWLVGLQYSGEPKTDPTWFAQQAEQPLTTFANIFPLTDDERELLQRTQEQIAPLRDMALPQVFEHGDLSHPNILLLTNGELGVVDWELAEPHGVPAYDLFMFLIYAAFARHNARTNEAYRSAFYSAFFGPNAWATPHVETYAARIGLPIESLTPLLVLSLARYVAKLLLRLGDADTTAEPAPIEQTTADWLRTNRYYTLWRDCVTNLHELAWPAAPTLTMPRSY